MAGSGVELVLLGLDIFPGYPTFAAAAFRSSGCSPSCRVTTRPMRCSSPVATPRSLRGWPVGQGALRCHVRRHHQRRQPGANGTEQALIASRQARDLVDSVKGGNEETDAGYQGLMAQANEGNPDLLVSLYDDGCIGTMRGRTALGITTPVLAATRAPPPR